MLILAYILSTEGTEEPKLYLTDSLTSDYLFFHCYQEGEGSSIGTFNFALSDLDEEKSMLSFRFDTDSLVELTEPSLLFSSPKDSSYIELWHLIEKNFSFPSEKFWLSNITIALDITCGSRQKLQCIKTSIKKELKNREHDESVVYMMDEDTYDFDSCSPLFSIPAVEPDQPDFVRFCFSPDSKTLTKHLQSLEVYNDDAKSQLDTVIEYLEHFAVTILKEYNFFFDILKDIEIKKYSSAPADNPIEQTAELLENNVEATKE